MESKIFGIGLSRTGTTSLHFLLEELGYKSKHFVGDLIDNPDYDLSDEYKVYMDSPVPQLYKALDKKYPGSKFILTTREKQKWLESMKWLFTHGKVIWNWPPSTHKYHKQFYNTMNYNKRTLSKHFDEFHKEVMRYFNERPNDLLLIDIDRDLSVDRVCEFLGVAPKKIEYPITNQRRYATLKQRLRYNIYYKLHGTNLP